jgi:hypothetical protein
MRLAINDLEAMQKRFQQVVINYNINKAGKEGKERFEKFKNILKNKEFQNPIVLLEQVCHFYKGEKQGSQLIQDVRLVLLDIFGIDPQKTQTVNAGSRVVTVNLADSELDQCMMKLDQYLKQLANVGVEIENEDVEEQEMQEYSSSSFSM